MNGGSKIVGLRRDSGVAVGQETPSDDELLLEEYYASEFAQDAVEARWPTAARMILAASAAIWLLFNLWVLFGRGGPLPSVDQVPGVLATIAIPLVLIGTIYLLLVRSSHAESRRFARTADSLRRESQSLEQKLSRIGTQLATAKAAMQEQAAQLESYGASASANLEASAQLIASHATQAAEQTLTAERAGAELANQITELVRTLPALQERAATMSGQLLETSQAMTGRIDSLERRLQAVMAISDDARLRTLSATKSLTTQLAQLQEETRSAADEINGLASQASQHMDTAITRARAAIDETGTGIGNHATALNALIERSHTALAAIGDETVANFNGHSDTLDERMRQLNGLIEAHGNLVAGLGDDLQTKLAVLEGRFAELERDGLARNERLTDAIGAIATQADRMSQALNSGAGTADQMIARSESLVQALDASLKEIEESYPAALGRLDARVEETRKLVTGTQPELQRLEALSDSVLGRLRETGDLFADQSDRITEWLAGAESGIAANRAEIEQLQSALQAADEGATRLKESAGPQLVATLVRVKDTAEQATERARQALARAIPDAVQAFGEASEEALRKAMAEQVTAHVGQLNAVAERTLGAAHLASDRLNEQLDALVKASAALEQRIADADEATQARERGDYARRSAQLIESLNSTAIDVAKVLSSDVADNDWSAYLKGDRGVFTRRAVRLLDAGEAREIALQYDGNADFRAHVNRYIHDFESMLRIILSARDGNALAITLLSSDMGKLYVALAQAIDRLR
ncbi:MAG: hypothetical protein DI547_00555 [Sphingobium sp.]|nr:MAG: hypothetical protein DI547_00555 [Sphingobium sp.]